MVDTQKQIQQQRPQTLAEVVTLGAACEELDGYLREFLDAYYLEPECSQRVTMLSVEPPLLEDPRKNAYLAAVAEHLSLRERLSVPSWALAAHRFLKRPYFPCGLESLKAILLVESPTAFRRRLIFVGADPLFRPRKNSAGV